MPHQLTGYAMYASKALIRTTYKFNKLKQIKDSEYFNDNL